MFIRLVLFFSFLNGGGLEAVEKGQLNLKDYLKVPVRELSGLTSIGDTAEVIAVGDFNSELATVSIEKAKFKNDLQVKDFSSLILRHFSICSHSYFRKCSMMNKQLTSQWEAITHTQKSFFLIQESTSVVLKISDDLKLVEEVIHPKALQKKGISLEGLVALSENKIIISTKAFPPYFITAETSDKVVREGNIRRSWKTSNSKPIHLPGKKCNISDLALGTKNKLYSLSENCALIAEHNLDKPEEVLKYWKLPKKVKSPEGLTLYKKKYFIVSSDHKRIKKNLYLLERVQ